MSDNGARPTAKTLALKALGDVMDEAARKAGIRPGVMGALLTEARLAVEAIQELKRARVRRVTASPHSLTGHERAVADAERPDEG
jgi:hypothetical protein